MYKEILGDKLKKARKDAGYSQEQVIEIIDIKISQSQLSKIESGKLEPSIETLGTLIDFYEVSADWVLGTGKQR